MNRSEAMQAYGNDAETFEQEDEEGNDDEEEVEEDEYGEDYAESEDEGEKQETEVDTIEQTKYMNWLVEQEYEVLLKGERLVESGQELTPDKLKFWRSQIRVPGYFVDVKLSKRQLDEVARRNKEQNEYMTTRVMRRLEYGSDYSSEYERVVESEYVTTDGENQDQEKVTSAPSVQVLREPRKSTVQ